ncbi:MAG: hypothetical protein ACP5XB_03975 [Isosphaeraceae bacterium]
MTFANFKNAYNYPGSAPLCYLLINPDGTSDPVLASYAQVTTSTSWSVCAKAPPQDQEFWCNCDNWVCATANFYKASPCNQDNSCPDDSAYSFYSMNAIGSGNCPG